MTIKNLTIRVGSSNWLIREAATMDDAEHAISMAICTGSIGGRHKEYRDGVETVKADVVRLNDDGTEKKPS